MEKQADNKTQLIIAVLLGVAGLLILLIFLVIRSQADDTQPTVTLENIRPSIISINIGTTDGGNEVMTATPTSSVDLTEGTTRRIYYTGTLEDLNGCKEIESGTNNPITVTSHRISVADPGGDSNSYNQTSTYFADMPNFNQCTLTNCAGGSDTQLEYSCYHDFQYYADITTTNTPKGTGESEYWEVEITIRDQDNLFSSSSTMPRLFEIYPLTAVDVSSSINYGSLSLGATSTEQSLSIVNTGNDNTTDLDMAGTDMTCTTGTIASENQFYTLTSESYGSAPTLSNSSSTIDFNLAKRTSTLGGQSASIVYWKLNIPTDEGSLAGSCIGTTTIYATPDYSW